jgi:hypothetical protein
LVPEDNKDELLIPHEHILQKVHIGERQRWRAVRNPLANLPAYLTDHKELPTTYTVAVSKKRFFGPLDLGSPFLKKWDALSLSLLFYTASVTPYEVAFLASTSETSTINVDMLFLLNMCVDAIFFTDLFIQIRTPFRDEETGRLVLSIKRIFQKYASSWFVLDLVSVLPFDFIPYMLGGGGLQQLTLLRFVRLMRLLKLLRVFRASRKLKRLQVSSGLRYATLEISKIAVVTIFLCHWMACGYKLVAQRR